MARPHAEPTCSVTGVLCDICIHVRETFKILPLYGTINRLLQAAHRPGYHIEDSPRTEDLASGQCLLPTDSAIIVYLGHKLGSLFQEHSHNSLCALNTLTVQKPSLSMLGSHNLHHVT